MIKAHEAGKRTEKRQMFWSFPVFPPTGHGLQTAPGHSCSLVSTGKPRSVGGAERVQLSGVFNVRKGKLALPVNRWSKRQVTLSGTCLIVSSVKHAHTGKMHILPLIGGKVPSSFLLSEPSRKPHPSSRPEGGGRMAPLPPQGHRHPRTGCFYQFTVSGTDR